MITSKYLSANMQDALTSLVSAVAGAVFALVAPNFIEVVTHPTTAQLIFDWTAIWHTSIATGGLWLGYRFVSPAKKITSAE